MNSQLILAAASLLLVVLCTVRRTGKPRRPPGPPTLPIIGSLPWLLGRRQPVWEMLNDFATRYGPIFGVQFGRTKAVFLAADDAVNDFLSAYASVTAGERMDDVVCKLANLDRCYPTCLPANSAFVSNLRILAGKMIKSNDALLRAVEAAIDSLEDSKKALTSWDLGGRFAFTLAADLAYGLRKTPAELAAFPLPGAMIRLGSEVFCHVTFASPVKTLSFEVWRCLHPWAVLELRRACKKLWTELETWYANMAQRLEQEAVEDNQSVFTLHALDQPRQQAAIMATTFFNATSLSLDLALRAVFGCVAYDREVQAELVRQLDGWQPGDAPPPLALSMVIEAIRLFPERPLSHSFILSRDITLRGYVVPKGTFLFFHIGRANTSKHDSWDPVGALQEGQGENTRPRWTFGFGRRRCPAYHYAIPAMATYLCAVLSRYQLDFADGIDRSKVTLEEALNLSFDGALQIAWPAPIRLTSRKAKDA